MNHTFGSDNYSGVHPEVMDALLCANSGHAASYGADEYTANAIEKFKQYFGDDIEVFFVYNGTGANVLGLSTLTRSYQGIICSLVFTPEKIVVPVAHLWQKFPSLNWHS